MNVKPVGNKVILMPLVEPDKTTSGLHLPQTRQGFTTALGLNQYRVLAVGPGRRVRSKRTKEYRVIPPDFGPGDYVLWDGKYVNEHQTFTDGVKIVDADEILAKILAQ